MPIIDQMKNNKLKIIEIETYLIIYIIYNKSIIIDF
jgi:hypothetical protein